MSRFASLFLMAVVFITSSVQGTWTDDGAAVDLMMEATVEAKDEMSIADDLTREKRATEIFCGSTSVPLCSCCVCLTSNLFNDSAINSTCSSAKTWRLLDPIYSRFVPALTPTTCSIQCAFRENGLLNSNGKINSTAVQAFFTEKYADTNLTSSMIQSAVNYCLPRLSEFCLFELFGSTSLLPCDPKPAGFIACMSYKIALTCPFIIEEEYQSWDCTDAARCIAPRDSIASSILYALGTNLMIPTNIFKSIITVFTSTCPTSYLNAFKITQGGNIFRSIFANGFLNRTRNPLNFVFHFGRSQYLLSNLAGRSRAVNGATPNATLVTNFVKNITASNWKLSQFLNTSNFTVFNSNGTLNQKFDLGGLFAKFNSYQKHHFTNNPNGNSLYNLG